MPTRLADQVALVTGAGRGIGQAIACAFASEGARVVVADVDAEAASATARAIGSAGGAALAVQTDVTSPEAQDSLFRRLREALERLDIQANQAGILYVAHLS